MLNRLRERLKDYDRQFLLFLLVGVFLGLGQSVDGSAINNFLKDRFDMMILQRSALEIPRELPGFLVFIIVGSLYSLGDVRIAAIANMLAAAGMLLLGFIPPVYTYAVICIFIYSSGQHIYMPLSNSIAMNFANDGRLGRKLGQVSAANTVALVFGSAVLFVIFRYVKVSYTVTFTCGAIAFFAASVLLLFMKSNKRVRSRKRFVFKKEYKLFYILSVLYGARKQIFVTFGPWVLVDVYGQKVATMTLLFFIISVVSIVLKPLLGYMIDKIGEKKVLGIEAFTLFFVCLGYSTADLLLPYRGAVILICTCYVLDQLSSAVAMARATYLRKIAVNEDEVSSTLSLGISIDHIMSMSMPVIGGLVWYGSGSGGYKYVFLGGAVIAVMNYIATRYIKTEKTAEDIQLT